MDTGVKVVEEDEEFHKKDVRLFKKDLRRIPCFRDSFVYGLTGGVAIGLICFMFTSKVRLSSHFAFFGSWVCILGYWFPCRMKYENKEKIFSDLRLLHLPKNKVTENSSSES